MSAPQQHVPLIGIVPSFVPEEEILRLKTNYCQAIEEWGGMPLALPITDDVRIYEYLLPQMDGFLFTGGHDISPECYGETRHSDKLSPLTPNRDRMEEEFGDLLFTLCHLARHVGLNAETALNRATHKFDARFRTLEKLAKAKYAEKSLQELSPEELLALWSEAKAEANQKSGY